MSFFRALKRRFAPGGKRTPGTGPGSRTALPRAVEKVLLAAGQATGCRDVLLVGGVTANARIRQRLRLRLEHKAVGFLLHFASPQAARDSAIGCAVLAWRSYGTSKTNAGKNHQPPARRQLGF